MTEETNDIIDVELFRKIKIRIGKVVEASDLENSNRLLKLKVDVGGRTKTVLSGIKKHYKPEDLIGRKVVLLDNLKPAKMMGVESEGMILAASDGDDNLALLTTDKDVKEGSVVS